MHLFAILLKTSSSRTLRSISPQRESHQNPMVFIPLSLTVSMTVNGSVTLKDRLEHQAQKVARQQQETGCLHSA